MKIAVINFSGNVGKSTVARHLLLPRIPGAELVVIESINADEGQGQALRGRQFGALQAYLQTKENAVVDIGASNVEELMALMRKYRNSHADFDYFVVPTVPTRKQQQDTISTLVELRRLGVPADRVRLVFNMVGDGDEVAEVFSVLLRFVDEHCMAMVDLSCRIENNEVFARVRSSGADLASVVLDKTDFKALIKAASSPAEKLALAERLATRRLADGVIPELDACFRALNLDADDPSDDGSAPT